MKILVTGSTGFIGSAVISSLSKTEASIVAVVRDNAMTFPDNVETCVVGDLTDLRLTQRADLKIALQYVDVVIHTAARAHILKDSKAETLTEFRDVNTEGTLALAQQAIEAGVKRFVFISSIGVNGNNNTRPFTETDDSNPQESYAISKFEAEQKLLALTLKTKMEVIIIRPPLVYGPNPPGNFATIIKWVNKRGVPLPFGAINNQRSFVALDNLVSFIIHCIDHPKGANETFLISDGDDVSTTELLRKVANAFGNKLILLPIPVSIMMFSARLFGKTDVANRLFSSLQVDSSKARILLGWKPVITMDEQLKKIADAYLNEKNI